MVVTGHMTISTRAPGLGKKKHALLAHCLYCMIFVLVVYFILVCMLHLWDLPEDSRDKCWELPRESTLTLNFL